MADVTVRPPCAADETAWWRLWSGFQAHFGGNVPDAISTRTWQLVLDGNSPLHGLLAEAGGSVYGMVHYSFTPFAWTASPVCFLQDLYVAEAARGTGAGRALVEGVYEAAAAAGAANVFWLADPADEPLKLFYSRLAIETPFVRFMQKPWDW